MQNVTITSCAQLSVTLTCYGKVQHNCTSCQYLVLLAKHPTARITAVISQLHLIMHWSNGLEAFHMKCQHPITKIRWQDHIRNSEVTARTGLGPVSDLITRRRNSVFGHIAIKLPEDTPAHQALRCHVDLTLGHLPDQSWKRRPGRPNNRCIDQLCRDNNNTPPADLWRRSTTRGHTGVMLRSSTTTR